MDVNSNFPLRHPIDVIILARMNIAKRFGRYEIQSELGRGGMAVVYHAFDPKFAREVAIKVLPRQMTHDPQFRLRFESEIKTIASLEHASIVPVYDVGEEDGQPYFVMRYMPGGSLSQRIAKGRLSLEETARIVEKIAGALAYAHQRGIVHRDVKSDNILFDDNNEPFISDFGVAKLYGGETGSLTNKEYVGTPAYMSPEQSQGNKLDGRSDTYSLGVVIYEALTGEQPYKAETPMGVAVKHVTQPVPEILKALPSLPDGVDALIKTALAKKKENRYPSPIALAKVLNLIAFGHEGRIAAAQGVNWFNRVKAGLVAANVILVIAIVGFFLLRNQLFASAPPAPAVPMTPSSSATIPPPTLTKAPTLALTETVAPISASVTATMTLTATSPSTPTSSLAPICAAPLAMPTPVVNWIDSFCVSKTPYTTVALPEGATFQPTNPSFTCKAEFTRNGKTTISCTGIPSYTFSLKVCQPSFATLNLEKCADGQFFDAQNLCCAPAPAEDAGCRTYKVDIRSCQ